MHAGSSLSYTSSTSRASTASSASPPRPSPRPRPAAAAAAAEEEKEEEQEEQEEEAAGVKPEELTPRNVSLTDLLAAATRTSSRPSVESAREEGEPGAAAATAEEEEEEQEEQEEEAALDRRSAVGPLPSRVTRTVSLGKRQSQTLLWRECCRRAARRGAQGRHSHSTVAPPTTSG